MSCLLFKPYYYTLTARVGTPAVFFHPVGRFRIFRPILARFSVRVVQVIAQTIKVSQIEFSQKLTFLCKNYGKTFGN